MADFPFRKIAINGLLLSFLSLISGCVSFSQAQPKTSEKQVKITAQKVVALGRLTPQGEVIKLSVANAEDSRVNKIFVNEGDRVKAGQVIAILQGIERRQRDLEEARKNVEFFQAKLEQIRSGSAKNSEIAAQRANIASLQAKLRNETIEREAAIAAAEAELRQAEIFHQRQETIAKQGAISRQALDEAKKQLETARADLQQRQAQLDNTKQTLQEEIAREQQDLATLKEVRPVDIRVARAELERSLVAVEQRKADLEDTKVKVPVAGQILRINTRIGEKVNTQQGIVELGKTDRMYAIAEVYETEISRVKIGQKATIQSEYGGFAGEVIGKVEHIALQVGRRQLTGGSTDPTTDENTRVVEVKIRIDPQDNAKVASLTGMQVRVAIDLGS
ncbi:MAG: HlyD family efflux transporter periplasmic adaptor subunit [Prochloraceae cyanobacterium]|nr:HlyD family efflux transporter periplasmic adaptor subunit [Prochloraceae cyanobacterium]